MRFFATSVSATWRVSFSWPHCPCAYCSSTPLALAICCFMGVFLVFCAGVTFIGNWIDVRHYTSASTWFDLGWALPYVVGGLVALTWRAPTAAPLARAPTSFVSLLGTNLVLVTLLFCIDLLMGRRNEAHGQTLTAVAVAASLLAFAIRLALTQYHQ